MGYRFPSNVALLYKCKMIEKKHRLLEKHTHISIEALAGKKIDSINEVYMIAKRIYDAYSHQLILASSTDSDEDFILDILILNADRLIRLIESVLKELVQKTSTKKRCKKCFKLKKQEEYSKIQWSSTDKKGARCISCILTK